MLRKRLVRGIALSIIMIIGAVSLVGCNVSKSSVSVWSAVNTEKIMQDAKKGSEEKQIVFNTFKGDIESAQIMFTPERDVESFNFEINDLKNSSGDKLNKDLFEIYAEKYIGVTVPSSKSAVSGFYPDALIPLKNYRQKRESQVLKGNNQGIWINLNVPLNVNAGEYTGSATLSIVYFNSDTNAKVDEENVDVSIIVKIYDVVMPSNVHTVSSFYLDPSMIGVGEGKEVNDELKKTYYDFMVSKRACVRNIPEYTGVNVRYNAKEFANTIVDYAKNNMVSSYALPYVGDKNGIVNYSYCFEVLNEIAKKNVELLKNGEEVDLFKKAHYYLGALIDEPTEKTYQIVRDCDLNIHNAKLDVANTGVLDDYPEIKDSLLSLCHVVTTKIDSILFGTDEIGGVQTWCPLIDNFSSAEDRQLAIDRMNSKDRIGGEGVWWYSCINPKNPWPSYQIDENLLLARVRGWMQFEYKIQGNLYWNVNYWHRYVNSKEEATDIWTEPRSWESANGDGRLIYPGSKYGVNGPISTVRLENIRESNEDYELLWLFTQTINKINVEQSKNYNSERILSSFYNKIRENVFLKEGVTEKQFDNTRIELLQLLETMLNDENRVLAQLDKLN